MSHIVDRKNRLRVRPDRIARGNGMERVDSHEAFPFKITYIRLLLKRTAEWDLNPPFDVSVFIFIQDFVKFVVENKNISPPFR